MGREEPALGSLIDLCQSLLSTFGSRKSGNDQGLHLGEESLASSRGNKAKDPKEPQGLWGKRPLPPWEAPQPPSSLCVLGWGRLLLTGVSISF